MSKLSAWLDNNITHSSEREAAKVRADKQINEFDALKEKTKTETDKLEAEKKFENDRREKKTVRRLKGGLRKAGFLEDPSTTSREQLG